MKKGNPKPLTPKLQAELEVLAAMPESEIDTTDMPPITEWTQMIRRNSNTLMPPSVSSSSAPRPAQQSARRS